MTVKNHPSGIRFLYQLSHLYGVQTSYFDVSHHRRRASAESLLSMLRSLGAPIQSVHDVPSAFREKQQAIWQRPLEPVIIAWDNVPTIVEIRLPSSVDVTALSYHLKLESGEERSGEWRGTSRAIFNIEEVEGTEFVVRRFSLPEGLPWGYHRLKLELRGRYEESLIISSPLKAYTRQGKPDDRMWGVFLPLYALRTQDNWGSGDYSDLERLMGWVGGIGGQIVATLPLLPAFQEVDADFSPYRPSSRLLWNEFYLDISRVAELSECPSALALISSASFQNGISSLRNLPLVDYKRQMALKRQVLEELSKHLFSRESRRLEDLRRFTEANPVVEDYARFRATCERRNSSWRSWSQPLREGIIKEGDYDETTRRYHLYAQWLAHQQMETVSKTAREKELQLYLDLPLGVHPDGYDVWREADAFVQDAEAGAPPDTVFTRGQNWEFPPLHPQRIREQGYQYVIAYLRHNLAHAGILRVDHVMGFHRLFCIPRGMESNQGVYLRYHAEELYAILALESQRHQTIIVGEDLGIVPGYVRPAMKKHAFNRMYVLRYELANDNANGLHPVPPDSVASLNTHDMPPFASFWQGLDIEESLRLGMLNGADAQADRDNLPNIRRVLAACLRGGGWLQESDDDVLAVLKACLAYLAASRARVVLVNLEDLWLEAQPQNVPSTRTEYPNWQRKMRLTFEEFCQMSQVVDILRSVSKLRQPGR